MRPRRLGRPKPAKAPAVGAGGQPASAAAAAAAKQRRAPCTVKMPLVEPPKAGDFMVCAGPGDTFFINSCQRAIYDPPYMAP